MDHDDPAPPERTEAVTAPGGNWTAQCKRNAHGSEEESEEESGEEGKGSSQEEVTQAHAVTISVAPLAEIVMARERPLNARQPEMLARWARESGR